MGRKFIIFLIAIFVMIASIWALVRACQEPLLYAVGELCFDETSQSYGIFIEYKTEEGEKLETPDFIDDEISDSNKMVFFHKVKCAKDSSIGDKVSYYWSPPFSLTRMGEFSQTKFKLYIFVNCFFEVLSALIAIVCIIIVVLTLFLIAPRVRHKYVTCRVRKVNVSYYNGEDDDDCRIFYVTGLDGRSVGFDGVENVNIDMRLDAILYNWRQIGKIIDLKNGKLILPDDCETITALKDSQGNWYFFAGEIPVRKLMRTIKRRTWLNIFGCVFLIGVCLFIIVI